MPAARFFVNKFDDIVPVAAMIEMAAEVLTGGERKVLQRFGPRHGRHYKRPGANAHYVASAPGEPPAIVERSLLQGIGRSNAYAISEGVWGIQVGSNAMAGGVHYPAILEMGGANVDKRPSWMVALQNSAKGIMASLNIKALRRKVGA